MGSEQFLYIDCGLKDKLVVVRTSPDTKIAIDEKVGLSIADKDLHFFASDGLRFNLF